MNNFERFLDKINFKKIFNIYFIISVIILLSCASLIAYATRDKIKMAIDYGRIFEVFAEEGKSNNIDALLNKLSVDSGDILNIIEVDKNYNVIYKANSNLINENNRFILMPYNANKAYLQDGINSGIIYKIVRNENIILNKDYIKNHQQVLSDIDADFSYEQDIGSMKINLLNYMINRKTDEKIFVIRTASPIPHVARIIEFTGLFVALIVMIYWIGLALWVYRDANRKNINPALWGILVLLTNLVGLIVFTIYKQNSILCQECGALQNSENAFCTNCGAKINKVCSSCHSVVGKKDYFCSKCGNEL